MNHRQKLRPQQSKTITAIYSKLYANYRRNPYASWFVVLLAVWLAIPIWCSFAAESGSGDMPVNSIRYAANGITVRASDGFYYFISPNDMTYLNLANKRPRSQTDIYR